MSPQTPDTTAPRMFRPDEVRLVRDGDGKVVARFDDTSVPVRRVASAFPLTEPRRMVNLFGPEGVLIGIITDTRGMDGDSAEILAEELEKAYFMPRIIDIFAIEEKLDVSFWDVQTTKGPRTFQVRGPRKNIRPLSSTRFVIRDVDSNRYEIRNWTRLPRAAQRHVVRYI